jgi:hypothetical protein
VAEEEFELHPVSPSGRDHFDNRLSVDPRFLGSELAKLLFNSSVRQAYEALLVLVAIALALSKPRWTQNPVKNGQ